MVNKDFWKSQRVFVTGHSGFKGRWLWDWLKDMRAKVEGYSLPDDDIRDSRRLREAISRFMPSIVFHMAAQPLVLQSYANPEETFSTNVQGTANLLDAVRACDSVGFTVIATSDKCYAKSKTSHTEDSPLGGDSPYAASKACAEIVAHCYRVSYGMKIATVRCGNVIGGGDFAKDRLIPDIVRASKSFPTMFLRMPDATRPWQHVLDALKGYLLIAQGSHEGAWNIGPPDSHTVGWVAQRIGERLRVQIENGAPAVFAEDHTLSIDSRKARRIVGWKPELSIEESLDWTSDWYRWNKKGQDLTLEQLRTYRKREAA